MKFQLFPDMNTKHAKVSCGKDMNKHKDNHKFSILMFIAITVLTSSILSSCSGNSSIIEPNETDSTKTSNMIAATSKETAKLSDIDIDTKILTVNLADFVTMITPSFTTPDTMDSFTIDDMNIIGNQYYADLSTDEAILTSPKNVQLIAKGEEYSKSKSEFTDALLEIGGQVYHCTLDKANYATVDGMTDKTFVVYDTKTIDSTKIDANSKILTTDGARVEYKTISEEEHESIDSQRYYLGIISIGSKDIILENAKVLSTIEGTDDILIAGKSEEYGYCLFKTSKHNVVLEKTVDADEVKPEIDGTTIELTGEAYINYKFEYETIYHQVSSITVTKDGMLYCYGRNISGNNELLTIIPSELCNIEMDQTNNILPEQNQNQGYSAPAIAFTRGTYVFGPLCLTTNISVKSIENETYLFGSAKYFCGDYEGKSIYDRTPNYNLCDLNSGAIKTFDPPIEVSSATAPINFVVRVPKESFCTTQLNLSWGAMESAGITMSTIGSAEIYVLKIDFIPNNGNEPYSNYVSLPIGNLIIKGSDTDLQLLLKGD